MKKKCTLYYVCVCVFANIQASLIYFSIETRTRDAVKCKSLYHRESAKVTEDNVTRAQDDSF